MGVEAAGGSGAELNAVFEAVERFVICMVTVIASPVPTEAGEAINAASRERLIQLGAAPSMVKPVCEETETDEKASVLNKRLSSGSMLLEV